MSRKNKWSIGKMTDHIVEEEGSEEDEVGIVLVGAGSRSTAILNLLKDINGVRVIGVADIDEKAPGMKLARELNIFITTDVTELFKLKGLDVIMDVTDDPSVGKKLSQSKPSRTGIISGQSTKLVLALMGAKKSREEEGRTLFQLQAAYREMKECSKELEDSKKALEKANAELNSRLAEIFFTHELSKALNSSLDVHEVSDLIVDGANGILGAEISCVHLLDAERNELYLTAVQGISEEAVKDRIQIGEGIVGQVAAGGQLMSVPDTKQEPSLGSFLRDEKKIKSLVAVPLEIKDKILGVLEVGATGHRVFTQEELERLTTIANMASLALQNAIFHEKIKRLSVTDPLTGLYNHGYFQQRLGEELKRSQRFGHPLSLIMLDIDHFKEFNDTFGHPKGDLVLKGIARILKENMRAIDIAARYGGEEFVAILPETNKKGALTLAERIRKRVEKESFEGNKQQPTVNKTVSLGVATYPIDATTQPKLIEKADQALYRAKRGEGIG